MQDIDTPNTHSLIDRYYEEERAKREQEMTLAELGLRLDANDLAMLGVIARRFQKSRDQVAQEVLSSALVDLLSRIEPGERKLMARDADEAAKSIAEEIAEENGIRDVPIRTGVWTAHDRQFTKIERQKEKAEKKPLKKSDSGAEPMQVEASAKEALQETVVMTEDEDMSHESASQVSETSAIDTVSATLEMQTDLEAATNDDDVTEENEEQDISVLAN